jgi:hypothetical protein
MSAATSIVTDICSIAEAFGRSIRLAEFQIDRVIHSYDKNHDEWMVYLRCLDIDPLLEDDNQGTIIIVDTATKTPRLFEAL